jgi:hypothetical protein
MDITHMGGLLLQGFVEAGSGSPKVIIDVIKSVTDPFSFCALLAIILGILVYRILDRENTTARSIILAMLILSFTALAFNALRIVNNQATRPGAQPLSLSAMVRFAGSKPVTVPYRVSFQTTSGQVNFGCGSDTSASTTFTLPPGARNPTVIAKWSNISNAKAYSQNYTTIGSTIRAKGAISGLDKDFFGNCPGGGHGEIILSGSYEIDRTTGTAPDTKFFNSTLVKNTPTKIAIPDRGSVDTTNAEVIVSSGDTQYGRAVINLNWENGAYSGSVVSKTGPIEVDVQDNKLVLLAI